MAKFMAVTSRGLESTLEAEVQSLGLKNVKAHQGGVLFEGPWADCYRANLKLRTATRILLPILDFPAYQNDELYHNIRKHDFTKYISTSQTLAVDASVRESSFKNSQFVSLKVKDAIVDQFTEKFGERPNVDTRNPDLKIQVRIVKNQVSVSVDTSGDSLSARGYRRAAGEAPLREHLAAGLVALSDWSETIPIVDPMCGSGTILIEAALQAKNIAPGTLRRGFAFQRLAGFQKDTWNEVVEQALGDERTTGELRLYGSDKDRTVIGKARDNAERAGVEDMIQWQSMGADGITAPAERGIIIVNPPYGERMGVTEELKDVYRDLSYILKREFKGWTAWVLSGNQELTGALKLKASRKCPVYNGPIECRFLAYEIR